MITCCSRTASILRQAWRRYWAVAQVALLVVAGPVWGEATPEFGRDIQPLLAKYCGGCHNADERQGELDVTTYASLLRGGAHGAAVTVGSATSSRLVGMLQGTLEPKMPPADEPAPTDVELDLLLRWIDAGAPAAEGNNQIPVVPRVPFLPRSQLASPVTSLDFSPDGKQLAAGGYQQIDLLDGTGQQLIASLGQHPGKVNDVRFSADGKFLLAATGITGVRGEAWLWDLQSERTVQTFGGHRDMLYTAALSDDGRWVATAGYDRLVLLHDRATGEVVHRLQEHHGGVFDLAFSPDSQNLVTASADATIKVWNVISGQRLDTRSEPTKEQITTAIHPSGQWFVGAGADNRIRMWQLLSHDQPVINPVVHVRFAHEGAVERLRYSRDGRFLASVARDRTLKVWDAQSLQEVALLPPQTEAVQALAIAPDGGTVAVGRMDGTLEIYPFTPQTLTQQSHRLQEDQPLAQLRDPAPLQTTVEQEPNGTLATAPQLTLPAQITGALHQEGDQPDHADLFAIQCQAGERWIMEVRAAQDQSPLDSYLDVLDADGRPVPRVWLQAVRDSYLTFRGKDSQQTGDFRLHNWEEMRLNQLLYCNGEVVRFVQYPRGPDSGFTVFPATGARQTLFDTTPLSHPLGQVCYIVEPYAPGSPLIANGLPVFHVPYANDDDSQRELGSDSRLTFDAPRTGQYWVRVRDTRQFHGPQYTYQLSIRSPQPHFTLQAVSGENPEMPVGDGTRFSVTINRRDRFAGPVRIDVTQVPAGFHVTTPLTVEPGQLTAEGRIWSDPDAQAPPDSAPPLQLIASSDWHGRAIALEPRPWGRPKLLEASKLVVDVVPEGMRRPDPGAPPLPSSSQGDSWPVLEMRRGSTASVVIRLQRRGFDDRVQFGSVDGALNAPFGVYVGNIGLNGILIPERETERSVLLIADPVTAPGERLIFFATGDGGRATSNPLLLRITE